MANLTFADANGTTITSFTLQQQGPGQSSAQQEVWIWNERGNPSGTTATTIRVFFGKNGSDYFATNTIGNGEEAVNEQWLQARSNGVQDPDATGIVDDAQTVYKSIGNNPNTSTLNFLSIGDMPPNTARKLQLIYAVPSDAQSGGSIVQILGADYIE